MWENFHQRRTFVPFIDLWNGFLKSIQCSCKPIFYQFITTQVFKEMIKKRFPIAILIHQPLKSHLFPLKKSVPFDILLDIF